MKSAESTIRYEHYIDGAHVAPSSGQFLPTENPYTGKVWAEIARGDRADAEAAVVAAQRAFEGGAWPALTASERGRLLWRVVFPAALPQIAAGVRTAIAIAIIVLVSSEFISSESGLGYLIFSYGGVGADDAMLAVVLYLAFLGYLLDRLYVAGLRHMMSWHAFAH